MMKRWNEVFNCVNTPSPVVSEYILNRLEIFTLTFKIMLKNKLFDQILNDSLRIRIQSKNSKEASKWGKIKQHFEINGALESVTDIISPNPAKRSWEMLHKSDSTSWWDLGDRWSTFSFHIVKFDKITKILAPSVATWNIFVENAWGHQASLPNARVCRNITSGLL